MPPLASSRMYRELTAADHQRILGIEPDAVPDVLLLVGIFSVHEGARRFAEPV